MQGQPIEVEVMSFNIRYGTADDGENSWPLRKEAVLDFLATGGWGLVGLQEVLSEQLQQIRQAAPHLHSVGVGRDDGFSKGEYAPILYDSRRFRVRSSGTFWFSSTPDLVASTTWGNTLPRICTYASFESDGRIIDLYNVHIDHASGVSRQRSIELLIERLHARAYASHTIVTGDFNEPESGPSIQLMLEAGFDDAYRTANPDGPEQATYHGWTGAIDGQKIDYIFLEGGWQVVDSTIVRDTPYGKFLSDHYPVVAILEL